MKVVILCGGAGIRLKDQQHFNSKAMVKIDDKPILWHIMKHYSLYGYNQFILALGQYGDDIRHYFFNYDLYNSDVSLTLGKKPELVRKTSHNEENWTIDFVNTGLEAKTGARLFRCQDNIDEADFMLSYADCLSDVDLDKLLKYHQKQKKLVTVTGVTPPYRYGEFILKDGRVVDYHDVAVLMSKTGFVNGGYMVLNKKIFNYLSSYNECTLEKEVFTKLVKKRELAVFEHGDFWQCLDNDREYEFIKSLCEANKKYWLRK